MPTPGSAEDIKKRGLWAVYKDVTGLEDVPHQLLQGMRSIPGAIVGLAELPGDLMGHLDKVAPENRFSNKVHDALGYNWQTPPETPFGQLAQLIGGSADVVIPGAAIMKGRNAVQKAMGGAFDPARRQAMGKGGAAAAASAVSMNPILDSLTRGKTTPLADILMARGSRFKYADDPWIKGGAEDLDNIYDDLATLVDASDVNSLAEARTIYEQAFQNNPGALAKVDEIFNDPDIGKKIAENAVDIQIMDMGKVDL